MAKMTVNVISYVLKRTVDLTVVIPTPTIPESMGMMGKEPARHTPKAKYPVLYLLHGMGNNHATWTGYTNVEFFAEERNIAVVMMSGENKAYIDNDRDAFFRFISEELPDLVTGLFPISHRKEDTFIAGLSMGGYGTLIHALRQPERFAALGAFSAACDGMGETTAENDPYTAAKESAAAGKTFPKMYIACGDKDFLFEPNLKFQRKMKDLGADVTWVPVEGFGHEWRFWNQQIEAFLDWIPREDPYAENGHSKRRQI